MCDSIETILKLWEKDSIIDSLEPGKELLRIPILHSKYLNLLIEFNLKCKNKSIAWNIIQYLY